MATLERALEIAVRQHAGQLDKGGQPAILHILRVVGAVKSPKARIAAALIDAIDEAELDGQRLLTEGFDREVVGAVQALTKRKNESRVEAAKRARANPIAHEVKIAENLDDLDLARRSDTDEKALHRIREDILVRRILTS